MLQIEKARPQLLKLLLRLLSINSVPLERFIRDQMNDNRYAHLTCRLVLTLTETSAVTRERLLDFLLCLMNDHAVENHSGASTGAVGLLLTLFEDALDPRTTSPDTLAITESLLPTQLAIVSAYLSDHLTRSDDETRVHVLNKLSQIHSAMPHWPILPWRIIEELLSEQVAAVAQVASWRGVSPVLYQTTRRSCGSHKSVPC